MSYKASVLFAPSSNMSLQEVEVKLLSFLSNNSVQRSVSTQRRNNKLVLTFGNWSLYIYLNSEPQVLAESQEMADIFAQNHPDKAVIATCDSRFEISCDPDNSMNHFNDYVLVIEQLSKIPGAFVFDDASQKFV